MPQAPSPSKNYKVIGYIYEGHGKPGKELSATKSPTSSTRMATDVAEDASRRADIFGAWVLRNPGENESTVTEIVDYIMDLWGQSEKLYKSYLFIRNLDHLDRAALYAEEIFSMAGSVFLCAPAFGCNLARPLLRRYQHSRHNEDISKAIALLQDAYWALKDDDSTRQICFGYLSIAYMERDGSLDGFVRELDVHCSNSHSQTSPSFSYETLVQDLHEKESDEVFDYFWETFVLDYSHHLESLPELSLEAFDSILPICQYALSFFSSDIAKIGQILVMLGFHLSSRYTVQKEPDYLSKGIAFLCTGLPFVPPSTACFGFGLLQACVAYGYRYMSQAQPEDFESSIRFGKQAMEVIDHEAQKPGVATCWATMAMIMHCRYLLTLDMTAVDFALEYSMQAIGAGDLRTTTLTLFATQLAMRALRTGREEDLGEAILTCERAMCALPPKSSDWASLLLIVSQMKVFHVVKLRGKQHLKEALDCVRQIDSIRVENPKIYSTRHEALSIIGIKVCLLPFLHLCPSSFKLEQGALPKAAARESSSFDILTILLSLHLSSIGVVGTYGRCNEKLRRGVELDKAQIEEGVSMARHIVQTATTPEQSIFGQEYLGKFLFLQYKRTGETVNATDAVAVLVEAFLMSTNLGVSHQGILIGNLMVDILSDLAEWDYARELSRIVSGHLETVITRSLGWQDKQFWLRIFGSRASIDASIEIQAGSDAKKVIHMLETCRGSILGFLIDNQIDLDDLAEVAPEKAELFMTLRTELNTAMDLSEDMHNRVTQTTRRAAAEAEFSACLDEIRKLENFDRFLLGSAEGELKAAAAEGPIVIVNVASIRSDAIIITKDAFTLLPLQGLQYQKVQEHLAAGLTNFRSSNIRMFGVKNKKYRKLQEWLWVNCVKLILGKLEGLGYCSEKFHLWWIPIGIASSLPFHVAGIYTEDDLSETALSRAISSYSPTLKILMHRRRKLNHIPTEPDLQRSTQDLSTTQRKPRLAIIIMPSTPGKEDLKGVEREAEEVQHITRDTHMSQIFRHPTANEVLICMLNFDVVHIACHGKSSWSDPSKSYLALQVPTSDSNTHLVMSHALDKLTVRDVTNVNLNHGKLAFLSACSTAQNRDNDMWDESLHLASGFHVAGYLHAIGNFWPSDDDVTVELVRSFYEHLVQAGEFGHGENIAKALNEATLHVAQNYVKQPLSWVQFVHFGV